MKAKSKWQRITAIVLATTIAVTVIPTVLKKETVRAASGKNTDNTRLGTSDNVDMSSILFSTLITGDFNQTGSEYKFTVLDPDLNITIPSGQNVTISGSTMTIPYEIGGANANNATRVSILVTNKRINTYSYSGKPVLYYDKDASILYYDELIMNNEGSGTFALPESIGDLESSIYLYILAEDINGEYETDYASAPLEIKIDTQGNVINCNAADFGHWDYVPAQYEETGNIEYYLNTKTCVAYIRKGIFYQESSVDEIIIPKLQIFMKADITSQTGFVDLNMYFPIPEDPTGTFYDQYVVNPENYKFRFGDIEKTALECPTQVIDGRTYYLIQASVPAKSMTDMHTFEVLYNTGASLYSGTTSIRAYADYVLDDSNGYDETVKKALRAMLAYGGAAQTYFGYESDNLADEDITGAGSDYSGVNIPENTFDKKALNSALSANGAPVSYYQMTLSLNAELTVSMYFKLNDGVPMSEAKQFVEDNIGIPGTVEVQENGESYVVVRKRGIAINELMTDYNLTYNGSEYVVNPGQYLYAASQRGSANLKPLVKALYNYFIAVTQTGS